MRKLMNRRNLSLFVLLPVVAALAGCPIGNVRPDDPYAVRVRELEDKVQKMDRVLENQSLVQLLAEIEKLRNEVRDLRGEVETLRYDVDGIRERQRDLYVDLDRRLQALESGASESGGAAGSGSGSGNDRAAYQAAFALLQESRYAESRQAFQEFISNHPQSGLIPNARYWLGEIGYVNKQFKDALEQFRVVVDKYPDSNKAPDAWLKIGYCHYELQQWSQARDALETVSRQFPEHRAAGLANDRLARMTREGR